MNARVLIIEDDHIIMKFLSKAVESDKNTVYKASNGAYGMNHFINFSPDVVLLDLGLPDMDGMALIPSMLKHKVTPIIVISARNKDEDIVQALDKGAIDYIKKPFSIDEVMARIRVAIRNKPSTEQSEVFVYKDLEIDFEKSVVKVNNEAVHLTSTEYKILYYLVQNQGKIVTLQNIQHNVWGFPTVDNYGALRVFINAIRKKINETADHKYILTEVGVGYRFLDK
ncbi:MAG: response regulator transcription factor [Acholeplasma sp.]